MTPHKHAALIKAWADNPQLEFQFRGGGLQSTYWFTMSPTQLDWSHSEVMLGLSNGLMIGKLSKCKHFSVVERTL